MHVLTKITNLLEDKKAEDIVVLNVHDLTSIADYMVIATCTSTTHIRSLAAFVPAELKKAGLQILAVEGQENAEWVLIDLGNILVHLMLAATRSYYELEKLWSVPAQLS